MVGVTGLWYHKGRRTEIALFRTGMNQKPDLIRIGNVRLESKNRIAGKPIAPMPYLVLVLMVELPKLSKWKIPKNLTNR